jgi:hypothetical protein
MPSRALWAVSSSSADDVWAVGVDGRGDPGISLSEHWDGTRWTPQKTPHPSYLSSLKAVASVSPTDVWALDETIPQGAIWITMHSTGPC